MARTATNKNGHHLKAKAIPISKNGHRPKANTNNPWRGLTPRQMEHKFCIDSHICDRCRSRWVPANQIFCDVCAAKITAGSAFRSRKNNKSLKKDRNPYMAEIIIAPDLARGKHGWAVMMYSDVGKLLTVRGLATVDIRDARNGKARITSFRDVAADAKAAKRKAELAAV